MGIWFDRLNSFYDAAVAENMSFATCEEILDPSQKKTYHREVRRVSLHPLDRCDKKPCFVDIPTNREFQRCWAIKF